jgi:hypothetical protein
MLSLFQSVSSDEDSRSDEGSMPELESFEESTDEEYQTADEDERPPPFVTDGRGRVIATEDCMS